MFGWCYHQSIPRNVNILYNTIHLGLVCGKKETKPSGVPWWQDLPYVFLEIVKWLLLIPLDSVYFILGDGGTRIWQIIFPWLNLQKSRENELMNLILPPIQDPRSLLSSWWSLTNKYILINFRNGEKFHWAPANLYRYEVERMDNNEEVEFTGDKLSRKKASYTKDKNRLYIKQFFSLDNGLWKLKVFTYASELSNKSYLTRNTFKSLGEKRVVQNASLLLCKIISLTILKSKRLASELYTFNILIIWYSVVFLL